MNKAQLITLIDRLEDIAKDLIKATDEKTAVDMGIKVCYSTKDLTEVIETLINHGMTMKEES